MAENVVSLAAAEQRLDAAIEVGDEKGWAVVARLLMDIDARELWRSGGYRSYSAWVRDYASRRGCSESLLWKYAKAGKTYERARAADPSLPPMESAAVGAATVATVDKIAPQDGAAAARMLGAVVAGELTPKEVSEQYRAVRKVRGVRKTRHDVPSSGEAVEGDAAMTRALTEALARDAAKWVWGASSEAEAERNRERDRERRFARLEPVCVRTLAEFPVRVETAERARRADLAAVCVENQTTADWMGVALRGVEVKVSEHDLERDEKMGDYAMFFDYMYIAVPGALAAAASDAVPPEWGVLVYDAESDAVAVAREADRLDAPRREEALATACVKLATARGNTGKQ